jgi:hypothetical protein
MTQGFQIGPKSSKIRQNPAKPAWRDSKEKALIGLDSHGRIEPFQGLALTPQAFFSLSSLSPFSPAVSARRFAGDQETPSTQDTPFSADQKGNGEKISMASADERVWIGRPISRAGRLSLPQINRESGLVS